MISIIIPWVNFILLNVFGVVCWYFYIKSVMPAHREEKVGPKAWEDCKRYRSISGFFIILIVIQIILWIWIPIPGLNWIISPNPWIPIIAGIAVAIPCTIILAKAVMDAGSETMVPEKDHQMYGGIYRHIRHPQMLGEMPWYFLIPLFMNQLFIFLYSLLFVLIVVPIVIHFEDKDLIKRFGDPYIKYREETGALIPKFWRRKKKH
ncbi:MAG: methyltransferase family protein [Promethearchaeota archaeon]